jgi:hypothetical protein
MLDWILTILIIASIVGVIILLKYLGFTLESFLDEVNSTIVTVVEQSDGLLITFAGVLTIASGRVMSYGVDNTWSAIAIFSVPVSSFFLMLFAITTKGGWFSWRKWLLGIFSLILSIFEHIIIFLRYNLIDTLGEFFEQGLYLYGNLVYDIFYLLQYL